MLAYNQVYGPNTYRYQDYISRVKDLEGMRYYGMGTGYQICSYPVSSPLTAARVIRTIGGAYVDQVYGAFKWDFVGGPAACQASAPDPCAGLFVSSPNVAKAKRVNFFFGDCLWVMVPASKNQGGVEKCDAKHLIAALNPMICNHLALWPFASADQLDELAGWAGDLEQTVGDLTYMAPPGQDDSNNLTTLEADACELIGADKNIKDLQLQAPTRQELRNMGNFPFNQVVADMDGFNVGKRIGKNGSTPLSAALQAYWDGPSAPAYRRFSEFRSRYPLTRPDDALWDEASWAVNWLVWDVRDQPIISQYSPGHKVWEAERTAALCAFTYKIDDWASRE